MALRIYIRQHSPRCLDRLRARITNGEIQPLTKDDLLDYRHCKCGWWIYGTSDSGVSIKPRSLKVYNYSEADKKRRELNRPVASAEGTTLQELLDSFLSDRHSKNRTGETEDIYKRIGTRVIEYCKLQLNPGVSLAKDVTREHILKLRSDWSEGLKLTTLNYHMGIVGMIFRHGINSGKLTGNPVQGLKPLTRTRERGADADEEEGDENGHTMPLDPEGGQDNYCRLLKGARDFIEGRLVVMGRKFARAKQVPVLSDSERFVLLMELMYETGLRISDAVHFRPGRMIPEDGECASYTAKQIKTNQNVTVFLPLALAERLAALKPLHREYVFFDGSMPWRRFISDVCYRTIVDLGNAVGVPGARPHRFRDSFAVNRLNELVSLESVSTMLGHSRVETTRKYYAPWVRSRHEVLKAVWKHGRQTGLALTVFTKPILAPVAIAGKRKLV